ncbi:MAG: carotenoid 1,2-hydratase [Burkholderiaceae bacterium]
MPLFDAISPALSRRALLMLAALSAMPNARALPPRTLAFPRDFGSHPELRTEWWYITGHATSGTPSAPREFGFQVTFFRTRVDGTQSMRSSFAARQLVFAHAAVTDLQGRKLHHDQRIARAGFAIAQSSEQDTDVRLRDWSLVRAKGERGAYDANVASGEFSLALHFTPTQAVLLQGDAGLSRKGPDPAQASYYYSEPQLQTTGRIVLNGQRFDIAKGTAWLDHEWSEALLHSDAVGWDWIGMNLDDGSALTAFHLRRRDGTALWSGGSFRTGDGRLQVFGHDDVRFDAVGTAWVSPRTRASYPTRWRVQTPAGAFEVRALLDDQELDSRGSTGAVYWEGVSDLLDPQGKRVGRGYLEMTGYQSALKM